MAQVIKLGWGVSVSLTITQSSLRRWAQKQAASAAAAAKEAVEAKAEAKEGKEEAAKVEAD